MKTRKLPKTDSIQALAKFWDSHDLTDFQDELEEVAAPVFARGTAIKVHLPTVQAKAVQMIADSKKISRETLIRQWVLQKLSRRKASE